MPEKLNQTCSFKVAKRLIAKVKLSKMLILYISLFIIALVQGETVEPDNDAPEMTDYMQEVTEYLSRLELKLDNIDDKIDAAFEPNSRDDMEVFQSLKGLGHELMDIVFLLDSSTSLMIDNFNMLKSFMSRLVLNGNVDSGATRVGLCLFSTRAKVVWNLNTYNTTHDILDAITDAPYLYGSTNIAKGLRKVRTKMFTPDGGSRPEATKVIVFMTDGVANYEVNNTIPEAAKVKNEGIHIFTVGIGLPNTDEIDAIASSPEDSFGIKSFDTLYDLVPILTKRLYFDNFDMPDVSFKAVLYSTSKEVSVVSPTLPYVILSNGEGFDPQEAVFTASDAGLYGFSLKVCSKTGVHASFSLTSGDVMMAEVQVQDTDAKVVCSWADAVAFLTEDQEVKLEYSGGVSEVEENMVYVSFSGVYLNE